MAEERYHQEWTALPKGTNAVDAVRRRDLVSELRLLEIAGDWRQVRSVKELDGQPVDDPRRDYNIGDVTRNVNTPLFALMFLEPAVRPRFRFRQVRNRVPDTLVRELEVPGAFRTSTEIWIVEYDERERPTVIRDLHGKNVPAHGRFWIEPESGRVLMSEIIAENREVRGTIDVSYQSEPLRGLLLPIEMREWYEHRKTGSRIETVAHYGQFRDIQE